MPANLHPLFVHFPIALLLSSVALSWAGRSGRAKAWIRRLGTPCCWAWPAQLSR